MSFESITSDMAPLDPIDDLRHRLRQASLARESLVYTVLLPEHKIAGFIYPRVSADGIAACVVFAFGEGVPGGSIIESISDRPVADSMDFTDWQVGGCSVKLGEPLRTAHVSYTGQRLSYDFEFEALHPAYSYDSHPEGCPKYFADNRFEQGGRIKGTMCIEGRTLVLDTIGQRDHSWGDRNWAVNYHYKWFHATTPTAAVHFFKMEYLGRSLTRGYVFKEGHMSQIKRVDVVDFTLDADMIHRDIDVSILDEAGRTTTVQGAYFAHTVLPVDSVNILNEVAMTTVIDGQAGLGWCEMYWTNAYLEHMRKFPALRR